jgi:signal transduction histidine kinase
MVFKDAPIRRKVMTVILTTSGAVLLLTCAAYFAYEFITFRQSTVAELATLGEIVAGNSTAALAFDSPKDADENLRALRADSHITAAALYDRNGKLFSRYPATAQASDFPADVTNYGYHFENGHLVGFQAVMHDGKQLGTLYLKSDMNRMYARFKLFGLIACLVIVVSSILAYILSLQLQRGISNPLLALAGTAKIVSEKGDYSVRAVKSGKDELGELTDAFNQMLERIERQTREITELNQNLEQRVVERTHDMEIANKELEAFSYSVSHDLRAPLRSIHGYMNIFAEEYAAQLDDEGKRLVNIIIRNGQRMGQLIDDLLEFSHLGRKEIIRSTISMEDIVKAVWDEQRRAGDNRNIELRLHPLPKAIADSSTMRQVWFNLISNAIKYTGHKDKAIIEIGSLKKDDRIVYYVKDNGAGFDMQYYNKLFGVFQRLHSVKDFDGTGVGLAIVQRIIAKHGGAIWAEAKPDDGATFYFSLPDV